MISKINVSMILVGNRFMNILDLTLHIYRNGHNALHRDILAYHHYIPMIYKDRSVSSVWTSNYMRAVFQAERTFSKTFTFQVPNMWKEHGALCLEDHCIMLFQHFANFREREQEHPLKWKTKV